MTPPRVSAVIPARGRPELVVRAVRSALAQRACTLEVVVVLDGPDEGARCALERIADARLRVLGLPEPRGPGAARNAGVRVATAAWVAFLDDDDEWVPGKLAAQLPVADAAPYAHPIVASRLVVRGDGAPDRTWPRRLPRAGEPLSEYLFATPWGDGLVHTSTLLVGRALLERVPFAEALPKHEDLDWLLRATRVSGAGLAFVPAPDPLAVWHADAGRPRASTAPDWRRSRAWMRSVRELVTARAYASFLLTWVAADAVRQHDHAAFVELAWEAFRDGRPSPRAVLAFLGIWTLPAAVRRRLGRRSA